MSVEKRPANLSLELGPAAATAEELAHLNHAASYVTAVGKQKPGGADTHLQEEDYYYRRAPPQHHHEWGGGVLEQEERDNAAANEVPCPLRIITPMRDCKPTQQKRSREQCFGWFLTTNRI